MTDTTTDDLVAALDRVRDYAEQIRQADRNADHGSLDRARDLELIYQAKKWADEMPAPVHQVWRGAPVDPYSRNRFASWVLQNSGLVPSRVRQLHGALEVTDAFIVTAVTTNQVPTGEWAVRPLVGLRRAGYADRIGEVYQRAVELADGALPTQAETKRAVKDFKSQFTRTQLRQSSAAEKAHQYQRQCTLAFAKLLGADLDLAQETVFALHKAYRTCRDDADHGQ